MKNDEQERKNNENRLYKNMEKKTMKNDETEKKNNEKMKKKRETPQ